MPIARAVCHLERRRPRLDCSFEFSKNSGRMAASRLADVEADFSNDFWPARGFLAWVLLLPRYRIWPQIYTDEHR